MDTPLIIILSVVSVLVATFLWLKRNSSSKELHSASCLRDPPAPMAHYQERECHRDTREREQEQTEDCPTTSNQKLEDMDCLKGLDLDFLSGHLKMINSPGWDSHSEAKQTRLTESLLAKRGEKSKRSYE